MSTAQELYGGASSWLYRAECTRRVRLPRCAAQVLRGVFVKYYDRVATVRLREMFLSTARPPCERAGCTPARGGVRYAYDTYVYL